MLNMINHKIRCILVFVFAFVIVKNSLADDAWRNVQVEGCTYSWNKNGVYDRLSGVDVVVLRDGPVTPVTASGKDGCYKISVLPGAPFLVLFFREDRVPELQQLAGSELLLDRTHVTLLTIEDHRKLYGYGSVKAKLDMLIDMLSTVGETRRDLDAVIGKLKGEIQRLLTRL